MKKFYLSLFAFVCFFIFSFENLNAASKEFGVVVSDGSVDISSNSNYCVLDDCSIIPFNYFYEKSVDSGFYNFLDSFGEDLGTYLRNYGVFSYEDIFIYTIDEFNYIYSGESFVIPDNATHVIASTKLIRGNNITFSPLSVTDYSDYLKFNISTFSGYSTGYSIYYSFFNQEEFLSYVKVDQLSGVSYYDFFHDYLGLDKYTFSYAFTKTGWWIFGSKKYTGTNFSWFLSKVWKTQYKVNVSNISDHIIFINDFIFDSKSYSRDDIPEIFSLDYFKLNSLLQDNVFLPFIDVYSYYFNLIPVPDSYSYVDFSNVNGIDIDFFPSSSYNSKSCNFYLYSSGSGKKKMIFYVHDFTPDGKTSFTAVANAYLDFPKSNSYLFFSPLNVYSSSFNYINFNYPDDFSLNESNFTNYHFRFLVRDKVSRYRIYYSDSCYSLYDHSQEYITVTHPDSNVEVSFSSKYDSIDPSLLTDSINYNSPNVDLDYSKGLLSSDSISSAKNGIGSIYDASKEILSLSLDLFNSLPPIVTHLIELIFSVFGVLLIIKLVSLII